MRTDNDADDTGAQGRKREIIMGGSSCCCPSREYEPQLTQRANLKSSKQRKCTDCCCFLIFFLSVGVMMLIQTAASTLGDPNTS